MKSINDIEKELGGRPNKQKTKVKSKRVPVYLSQAEYDNLEKVCEANSISKSEAIRWALRENKILHTIT